MAPKPQEKLTSEPAVRVRDGERVVISGISGLYPMSNSVKEFNEILYNKINPITSESKRWKSNHPEVAKFTGTAPGLDRFDAQFFKVHFRLGTSMDAMSKKILEQTYQAIYDAGCSPEDLNGKKVAVFIGACFSEAEKASFYVASTRTGFGIVGCSKSMFANRISYWLNAKGPSMSVDEACCSSAASLALAYQALARGDCEAALVGGANLYLHPQSSIHTGRIIPNCLDGKTKSFDENADGCVKSEAIQVVFLQKAKDALRVYAEVIKVKNEYITHSRKENEPEYGFYRDPVIMSDYLRKFYEEAKVPPQAVEYVEANGSATPAADKSELESISEVFCKGRTDPLLVGSVFSNIGYTEASSGLCGIVKVLLAYQRGEIASNLHCTKPRKDIPALQDGRMRIVMDHEPFRRSYVAINNHSVTGCTAHILLHGHYKPKDPNRYQSSVARLVTISARQESAVKKILDDLKSRPIDPEELALLHKIHCENISGHLGRGFIILDTNAEKETVSVVEQCEYFDNARRPLWFVYSGMGSQWAGMGIQLMRIPVFAAAIERCQRALQPKGIDLIHIITSTDKTIFDNILHSFVGIAAVQIGLTDVLYELGLHPDKIIGHSVGELGCAYADGCFTAEEMILSAYSRGLVSVQTPFIRGSMAAVGIGYEKVKDMIPSEIEIACHNSAESSTISGPADIMKEFVATLTAKGIFAKEVPCSNIAYHSRYIAEAGPGLLKYLSDVIKDPKPRSERWVSTSVPQDRWEEPIAKTSSADYHTNNLLNPVLFEETSRLIPSNAVLVEIAPHGLLQAILKRSLPASCKHIPLTRRGHPDNTLMVLEGIGKLYMEGYNSKVDAIYPKVEFPVSTGTPMLSHLVEWAHNETWLLPLYVAARRKTAAAATYKISLHDPENSYLSGHVVRGKNVYPFAAALVAVWDTLTMLYNKPKKETSVMFYNVQFFVQPLLNDRRQLNISVGMHRGTHRFEVMDGDSKVVTGFAKLVEEETNIHDIDSTKDINLNSQDVYQMLFEREYSYGGDFRSISGADVSLTEALLLWKNNYVTILDGMLQLNFLREKHDAVSQLVNMRKLLIDTGKHVKTELIEVNGEFAMRAEINELYEETRCGGIVMEGINLNNLPTSSVEKAELKTLKFIPRFSTSPLDMKTSLSVFLQIVTENINKESINVIEILNSEEKNTVFDAIKDIDNILGVKVNFKQIHRETPPYQDVLCNADLVLVHNLSMEDDLCRLLYSGLRNNVYVLSTEGAAHDSVRVRPSTLYQVVATQNSGDVWLHLSKWRPVPVTPSTIAFTVRTHNDISLLTSTRNCLPPNHKLLVLTSYPPVDGLKDLVQLWRKDVEQNNIYLVMVNHNLKIDESLVEVPELNLAVNVLDNGVWGGEYFVPLESKPYAAPYVTLQSKQIGDLNSLTWVEALEPSTSGIPVTVHYAGLNTVDSKRATGVYAAKQTINSYGMDFSGVTDCGVKVMGLVPSGAASSRVNVQPELLWPVPKHWTMEEAATIPMPYVYAFYCLAIKVRMLANTSILVHGGAGALGQAAISIALAHGLQVFTTVSDLRKKHFLRKLFPELKDEHIGNSRDPSFGDMIMTLTNGKGVTYVINCVKGELKNTSLNCTSSRGALIDTIQIHSEEDFNYGMFNLTLERCYIRADFFTIFNQKTDMIKLQWLISEGISHGYVRPLSRVTYDSNEAPRAFRLLDASQHRGRVLLRFTDSVLSAQPRITCSKSLSSVVVCDDDILGLQVTERLVKRGSRKLLLHLTHIPPFVLRKAQYWKQLGVDVKISVDNLNSEKSITSLLNDANNIGVVEGIYFVIAGPISNIKEEVVNALDVSSRKLCPSLKHFAVVTTDKSFGNQTCFARVQNNLAATKICLPPIKTMEGVEVSNNAISLQTACDAFEYALRSQQPVVMAHVEKLNSSSLLRKIAAIADIEIPESIDKTTVLKDLGISNEKVQVIAVLLRDEYNQALSDESILSLTINDILKLDGSLSGADLKETKGLQLFYSYFDSDELSSTTEIRLLPTLVNSCEIREDEFDMTQTYLCIIPGLEGHYHRFKELCERVKLPAFVLQPGLDIPNESIKQMAARFAQVLLKKVFIKNHFYLLGYESGIIVALEIASILEEHGLTGTIYCIGTAPEQFISTLESELHEYQTDEELQNGVIRHMYKLITGADTDMELDENKELRERVAPCVRDILGKVALSAQYALAHLEVPYYRIQQVRRYISQLKPLQSKLVLLRSLHANQQVDVEMLQKYSQEPLEVHDLTLPFTHALKDQRCAAFINQHLDTEILKAFDKRNMCDTYVLNTDSFMTLNDLNDSSE